jgi:hypothetical protein
MFRQLTFSEVSRLYTRKLVGERSLLAIAKHQEKHPLDSADIEALSRLERLLSNVSEVQNKTSVGSLAADSEGTVQLIVRVALVATQPTSTLQQLLQYLDQLGQTASNIASGQKPNRTKVNRLTGFLETLTTGVSEELAMMEQSKAVLTPSG